MKETSEVTSETEISEQHRALRREYIDFLERRGIGSALRHGRHVSYLRGDIDRILDRHPALADYTGGAKFRADISDGILIVKYPVPGVTDPILPQFRPFGRRLAEQFNHDHAMFTAKMRALHIRSEKWGHGGDDVEGEHPHEEFYGKYMLMRSPRERYLSPGHDVEALADRLRAKDKLSKGRALDRAAIIMAKHVKNKHGGVETDGAHEHEGRNSDPEQKPEMRLDMHPRAAEMLPAASRVFFSIEGSIKGDAILSAGDCAFSVPSVTMWRAPEREAFYRDHLTGKTVFVVCDSDWATNPQVALQAFECRDDMRRIIGPDVHVAAAPDAGSKVGIDDYLGGDGTMDKLLTLEREMSPGFTTWAFEHLAAARSSHGGRGPEAAANDVTVLRWMATHADTDGVIIKATPIVANYSGLSADTIGRAARRLVAAGALTTGATPAMLAVRERYTRTKKDGKLMKHPQNLGEGWDPRAEFTIRPDLRATVVEPRRTVGDIAPR